MNWLESGEGVRLARDGRVKCSICLWPAGSPQCYHNPHPGLHRFNKGSYIVHIMSCSNIQNLGCNITVARALNLPAIFHGRILVFDLILFVLHSIYY